MMLGIGWPRRRPGSSASGLGWPSRGARPGGARPEEDQAAADPTARSDERAAKPSGDEPEQFPGGGDPDPGKVAQLATPSPQLASLSQVSAQSLSTSEASEIAPASVAGSPALVPQDAPEAPVVDAFPNTWETTAEPSAPPASDQSTGDGRTPWEDDSSASFETGVAWGAEGVERLSPAPAGESDLRDGTHEPRGDLSPLTARTPSGFEEFIAVAMEPDETPVLASAHAGRRTPGWPPNGAGRVVRAMSRDLEEPAARSGNALPAPASGGNHESGPAARQSSHAGPVGQDLVDSRVEAVDLTVFEAGAGQDPGSSEDDLDSRETSTLRGPRTVDLDPTPALGVHLDPRPVPPEWGTRAPNMSDVRAWGQTIQTPIDGLETWSAVSEVEDSTVDATLRLEPVDTPQPVEDALERGPLSAAAAPGDGPEERPIVDTVSLDNLVSEPAGWWDDATEPTPVAEAPDAVEIRLSSTDLDPSQASEGQASVSPPSHEPGGDPRASQEQTDGSDVMQGSELDDRGPASLNTSPTRVGHEVAAPLAWQPPGAPLAPPVPFEEADRAQLAQSLPKVDESTPLAAEVAEDARRRIELEGRSFPRPPRTRVLTVANQKGGVGKTTTTVNVAAALAQSGLRVLVLDIDPQGNASTALGIDHHAEVPSLYDVVVEDRPLAEVVQQCPDLPNLWVAPATIDLAGAEIELVSFVAREVRLKKALELYLQDIVTQGRDPIDYVFIDCPPSLSLLTVNAFVAAREVLIPIQCEYYALEGLSQLLKHIELIQRQLNPALHVSTIMLTMYDGRTRLSSQVAEEVRTHFPEQVVKTAVPRSVRISEAPSHGQTVMTYDPASSGALSYLEASRELAEQVLTWESSTREERL